jgi:hypothetical protein
VAYSRSGGGSNVAAIREVSRRVVRCDQGRAMATEIVGDFEWDSGKADANWRKHRVTFMEAVRAHSSIPSRSIFRRPPTRTGSFCSA